MYTIDLDSFNCCCEPEPPSIMQPDDLLKNLEWLKDETTEKMVVVPLDSSNHVLAQEVITSGITNKVLLHPREVFRAVLKHPTATSLILVHNHPSGRPDPSKEDIDLTRIIAAAANVLQFKLLDHRVVGKYGAKSIRQLNPDLFN